MENELTVIRFRYRVVGEVADAASYDFDTVGPPRKVGDTWKQENGHDIYVCIAVEGNWQDAVEDITEWAARADAWFTAQHPGVKIKE